MISKADRGTFLGDIAVFTGEPAISACIAAEPTDVIASTRAELREMLAGWPHFAEIVLQTMMARRAWHEGTGHGVLRLIHPARVKTRIPGPRPARAQPASRAHL